MLTRDTTLVSKVSHTQPPAFPGRGSRWETKVSNGKPTYAKLQADGRYEFGFIQVCATDRRKDRMVRLGSCAPEHAERMLAEASK